MKTVDTRGLLCPAPLIAAKRALKETGEGESFLLLTDNRTSFNNVSRFLSDNDTPFSSKEEAGIWTLTITKGTADLSVVDETAYCVTDVAHFEKGDFVVVLSSDLMGTGDEDLGKLLISNFIKALKDLDKLPSRIVFYNKGVTLATKTSPVIGDLRDLEKMGVELLLCGTCIAHYGLNESYGAGILSNMYSIADAMTKASSIIKP